LVLNAIVVWNTRYMGLALDELRSCQDLWTFLPQVARSGHGVTSVELDVEELGNGEDVVAAGTPATEVQLAAHEVAVAAATLSQETLLARWALVDSLGDEPTLAT
jgi:hypothetical protein